jgi:hypothetical protein
VYTPNADLSTKVEVLDHALAYAARGWSIIAVAGKKAVGLWTTYQTNPPDKQTLVRLFAKKGITGLAVILGKVSGGLAVRDFDKADAYHAWAEANPEDASRLPTVRTARGFHVYGRLDEETFAKLSDGELIGNSRHIVVLPPSAHPDGGVYTWVNPLPSASSSLPVLPPSLMPARRQERNTRHNPPHHIACVLTVSQEFVPEWAKEVIASSLPSGPGQRNRRLFDLARGLKRLKPDTPPEALRQIVHEWHREALPVIRTKPFDPTWQEFITAWNRINWRGGIGLEEVVAAALEAPFPRSADAYDTPEMQQLVAVCAALQEVWNDRPFFLPVRGVEKVLGVPRMTANRMLATLQFDGVLKLVTKGSKRTGNASEYLYRGDQPEG